jgi:hypothetical protein
VNVAEHRYADNKHAYENVKVSFASQHCAIGMAASQVRREVARATAWPIIHQNPEQ